MAPHAADSWWNVLRRPGSMTRWVAAGTLLSLLVAWATVAALLAVKWRDELDAERAYQGQSVSHPAGADLARAGQCRPGHAAAA